MTFPVISYISLFPPFYSNIRLRRAHWGVLTQKHRMDTTSDVWPFTPQVRSLRFGRSEVLCPDCGPALADSDAQDRGPTQTGQRLRRLLQDITTGKRLPTCLPVLSPICFLYLSVVCAGVWRAGEPGAGVPQGGGLVRRRRETAGAAPASG